MNRSRLKAFAIEVNGKMLDYRVGASLNLREVEKFFRDAYEVISLRQYPRHVTGVLMKNTKKYFLKLATTEGISAVTKNEYLWNDTYNRSVARSDTDFWVPKNVENGLYPTGLYYMVTELFEGDLLVDAPEHLENPEKIIERRQQIIACTELIQHINVGPGQNRQTAMRAFVENVSAWFNGIPQSVRNAYDVERLYTIVQEGVPLLSVASRHGDFAPWHLVTLPHGKLGILDGEHYRSDGVSYYDIGYFIQRAFCVLQQPVIADALIKSLYDKRYDMNALRVVLAARGIGGYLDASLADTPNYAYPRLFQEWIISDMRLYGDGLKALL